MKSRKLYFQSIRQPVRDDPLRFTLCLLACVCAGGLLCARTPSDLERLAELSPAEAIPAIDLALADTREPDQRARLQLLAAKACRNLAQYDRGLERARLAARMARKSEDNRLRLDTRLEEGIHLYLLERYDEALATLEVGLALDRLYDFPEVRASTLNALGLCRWKMGDLFGALDLLQESVAVRQDHGLKDGLASCFNNLGIIYLNLKDHHRALEYHNRALELRLEDNDPVSLAATYSNLGEVYNAMGDFDRARELTLLSLEIEREVGDIRDYAYTLLNLGEIASSQGHFDEAQDYFKQAATIQRQNNFQWDLSLTLLRIGQSRLAQKRWGEALVPLREGLEIAQRLNAKVHLKDYSQTLALVHFGLGDKQMANYHEQQATLLQSLIDRSAGSNMMTAAVRELTTDRQAPQTLADAGSPPRSASGGVEDFGVRYIERDTRTLRSIYWTQYLDYALILTLVVALGTTLWTNARLRRELVHARLSHGAEVNEQ